MSSQVLGAVERAQRVKTAWLIVGMLLLGGLAIASWVAPENLSPPPDSFKARMEASYLMPWQRAPFGTDGMVADA